MQGKVKLMGDHGKHVAIDVPELSTFRELVSYDFVMCSERSIFRIPGMLYTNHEKAYRPSGFSIGPWHYREKHLQATQAIKLSYLEGLISRSEVPNLLGKLQEEIRQVEAEARKCYASPIDFSTDEFVKILVLDGCFIIELLLKYAGKVSKEEDPIFTMSCMLQFLYHDLILLENQVPWLVLELLFWLIEGENIKKETASSKDKENEASTSAMPDGKITTSAVANKKQEAATFKKRFAKEISKKEAFSVAFERKKASSSMEVKDAVAAKCKLIELALKFFGNIFSSHRPPPDAELFSGEDIKHILDLLRLSVVVPFKQSRRSIQQNLEWLPIPTASRLNEAGVKFIRVASDSILDIRFRHGALEMPTLLIQETTETIFRNLISYEQCLPNCRPVFTSYAKLLDNLVDSTDDIELLGKKEVVDNWLSPEDATRFFNGLYNDTFVKEFFYPTVCRKLNHHCRQLWPKWRAAYVKNYFTKPWAIAAQIFALVMFVLTFLQTFYTIKS